MFCYAESSLIGLWHSEFLPIPQKESRRGVGYRDRTITFIGFWMR